MKHSKSMRSILLSSALLFSSLTLLAGYPGVGRVAAADQAVSESAKEDPAIFESATNFDSNLSGWHLKGKGKLEETELGLLLSSEPRENVMAISETKADNFIYEADVMVKDSEADATLIFRSNEDGWSSYMLQIVPNAGLIRLRDANGAGKLKEERQVTLAEGEIYHLKVKAEGTHIKVYWGDRYQPIMDVHDGAYSSGFLGLNVWDGSALFQNVKVSELKGNLGAAVYSRGAWQPDLLGERGTGTGAVQTRALRIYREQQQDLVLEGNLSFGTEQAEGALLFRANESGTEGYEVALQKDGSEVRAQLRKADGTVIKTSGRTYLSQPSSRHHLEIRAVGSGIQVYVDGYAEAAIEASDNSYAGGHAGFSASAGTSYFQDVYLTAASDYYSEKYRPAYHYSPARGSASDPNGLVFYEGEYHLFHQDGGTWAHAVSSDLVHWKPLPIALPWNDHGHVWSGSAVADLNNDSGLFTNSGGKGLVAYYTSFNPDGPNGNQRIGLAYSTDNGRTWEYSKEHPIVIENPGKQGEDPGGWDFRDPKVVRDEERNCWVMVVSGGDHIRFFTSSNLIDWTLTDNFGYGDYVRGGVWECPDLFQLKVDGKGETKWVLMISTGANPNTQGSAAEYFLGELTPEGKFINDNPAGKVLTTDYGKEFYASMSFSNLPDHRRVMLAWMTNWDYPFAFPTQGWKGELTVPREVTLKRSDEGIVLAQAPVEELKSLRSELYSVANKVVNPNGTNLLKGLSSGAYEIEAEIEVPGSSKATEFGFHVREGAGKKTVVGYKVAEEKIYVDRSASGVTDFSGLFSTLHEAPMQPRNGTVKLHIFVDESSVEVFGNDGSVVFSEVIFPDHAGREMSFYVNGGKVNVASMKVHALDNIWNEAADSSAKIMMDTGDREMGRGDELTLYASVANGKGNGAEPLKWKTSDSSVVKILSSDKTKTVIQAADKGEAVITASSPNGKTSANVLVKVFDGKFHTNLTGWSPDVSSSKWVSAEQGIRGGYESDAAYMARETAGDFIYEADMTLAETGGAGSILFRASPDGRNGYYFNIDPNMKAFRLFYKADGGVAERQVLAKVPTFVQPGKTYRVKIEAEGPKIRVTVDGEEIMDLTDGTFAEGHFGIHVFGGQAYFQNVNASRMQAAKLQKASFVNVGTGKSLYASKSQNGEPVTVMDAGVGETDHRTWILMPTGDEQGSYSIRTPGGKALDLDSGQNKIQLYNYLGFNNQRWLINKNADGTVNITSVHHHKALEVSEDGARLLLNDPEPDFDRQKWRMEEIK
ncbi:GH32 C-terminal domain-containing protein [Fontibacillus phaseoli]|nr:GH32 C-terminal domain-containing protein [Fontibacillus phaseoli]